MKFIRSLPLMWARTRWPFSSSTANIVLGSGSMTVPSTSIASFLATGVSRTPSHRHAGPAGADTRTLRIPNPSKSDNRSNDPSDGGEDLRSSLRDRDRVFEVGGQRAVPRDDRPAIRPGFDL